MQWTLDRNGNVWCSTKTDPKTMKHVGGAGSWGFCTNEHCQTTEMRTEKTATKATIASLLGMYISRFRIFLDFQYQGGVKSTVSSVFEDLKFKISEGYKKN